MQMLNTHLLERHAEGKQVVMFVEIASIPLERSKNPLLSNLETAHSNCCRSSCSAAGTRRNLRQPQIRQLREASLTSFRLSPLNRGNPRLPELRLRARVPGTDIFPRRSSTPSPVVGGLTRRINLMPTSACSPRFENTQPCAPSTSKRSARQRIQSL